MNNLLPLHSRPFQNVMRIIVWVLLGLLFMLALVRAALYIEFVVIHIWTPFDAHHLEAVMVHLAWRVQHGVRLYPDWEHYPHVANFYSPLNFIIIGALGRALGTSIEGLYAIGRGITVGSVLLTSLIIGVFLGRRHSRSAALLGVLLSLGVGPLYSAGVMTRPDALAELLGLSGFFLAGGTRSMTRATGGVLLYLAAMTKQTALVYLVAALFGLYFEGRGKQARVILAGVTSVLLLTVLAVRFSVEPNFVRCLLGESRTPADFETWWNATKSIAVADPEFFILTVAGIVIWSRGPRRQPMLAMLAALLFAACFVTAAKCGSAQNYFLGMRSVAALAAGDLWLDLTTSTSRPRGWEIVTVAAVVGALVLSTGNAVAFVWSASIDARLSASDQGKVAESLYRRVYRDEQDPGKRILTDSGMLDIRQGERTVFGDSYRFKLMVENGQIDPRIVQMRIDNEYYDVILCKRDLFSPDYERYDFGLPRPLAERARRHYELLAAQYGLYIYGRRGKTPRPAEKPRRAIPRRRPVEGGVPIR